MTARIVRHKKVAYVDIDGTVRLGKDDTGKYVKTPSDVRVWPKAVDRMREWKDQGGLIVGVTNQGGVALGHLTEDELAENLEETDRQTGGLFDAFSACPHHPDARLAIDAHCLCRKPSAGAIVTAMYSLKIVRDRPEECYPPHMAVMVGDRDEDEACARAAGIRFLWAKDWRIGGWEGLQL